MIQVKRIYAPFDRSDGHRVLVDRLWPRGIRKADARLDAWLKDLAPSRDLRAWFAHDSARWDEFCLKYRAELHQAEVAGPDVGRHLDDLVHLSRRGTLTLLCASRDVARNNAVALMGILQDR